MFNFLSGYKVYIAGGLMALTGLAQMVGVAPETFSTGETGWELVLAALALVGIGHKIDKTKS